MNNISSKNFLCGFMSYGEGESLNVSIDYEDVALQTFFNFTDKGYVTSSPNSIFYTDEHGVLKFGNPFDHFFSNEDKQLREENPNLKEAWKTLMEALHEYETTKKLVKDQNGNE